MDQTAATSPSPATVLVAGGTGYVGSWVIVRALQRGFRVRTTVRSPDKEHAVRAAVATQINPSGRLEFATADLTDDAGWAQAMHEVDYVLHVASPLPNGNPRDPDELIAPAREGTLRVLRAAVEAGVQRVVLTSSGAAATSGDRGEVAIDDRIWTDPEQPGLNAYRLSKILAERAAWDFIAEAGGSTELVTVLPGAIFGPPLPGVSASSSQIVDRMLNGSMRAVPRVDMSITDVRDLATAHLDALEMPDAADQRFLTVGETLTMLQMAEALRSELGELADKAPRRTVPDAMLRFAARFNPEVQALVPMLGRHVTTHTERARTVLGWNPRPAHTTIVDTGRAWVKRQDI